VSGCIGHLAGKRIQLVHQFDSYHFRVYSGTHRIFEIAGRYFSLEIARREQKTLANIMGFRATHKIIKIKRKVTHK